ncbi:MAG TPA: LytTR family transcriptional regulator DNA-binding domain-containing protein [Anaerolineales bacterium]|nr:LytTR family transcriptional regulator DNA-binding domain-containing protein [Anaerolineales bacterium]
MIELRDLQKVVEQRTVIDIPRYDVSPGEIRALVGPAGSGKGQLLDLLVGRSQPSKGTVRVGGVDPRADRAAFAERVGILFADDGLYSHATAFENLRFFCRLHGLPAGRADEVLGRIGLADQPRSKPGDLTGGLRRRLAFGRALLHAPSTLLLIEPFARCDGSTIALLGRLVREEAERGVALLTLASEGANLDSLCDSVASLQEGRIIEDQRVGAEASQAFKIPVRTEGSVILVNPADIFCVEADEGRASLVTTEGPMPTHFTMAELEARLAGRGFFRAHRSYLVNLQHVREVIPFTRNSYSLRLNDPSGTLIPLSRTAAAQLRDLLGY